MTETVQPEWLQGFTPQPNKPPKGWQPGQSGNPKGRPVGSRNRKNVIAEEFEKDGSAVARVVMDAALEGDMQAANMVLQRLSPPLREPAARGQAGRGVARAEGVTTWPTRGACWHGCASWSARAVQVRMCDEMSATGVLGCRRKDVDYDLL